MLLNQAMCKPSLVSAWCNLYRWCSALDGVLDDEQPKRSFAVRGSHALSTAKEK
jgi:hypothetical protein